MSEEAIVFKHVGFRYGDGVDKVLKDIDFSIHFGKITLLTGRTGIGKTTLFKILTRVIPEDIKGTIYGDILVNGETIARESIVDMSKKIGFVMQDPECQIFHEKVHDELLFGMENLNIPKEKALNKEKEMLNFIKIQSTDKTKSLSGGQKALLIIESVMAMEQNIIVLDEPLANLDLEHALKLLQMLKEKAKEGKAIIICEHRTSLVMPFADDVYHIKDGCIKSGTGDDDRPFEMGQKEKSQGEEVLTAKEITKSFGQRIVLNKLSFSMKKGTISVILGTNGQGKTTLLNCLSGQTKIKAKDGEIEQNLIKERIGSRKWFEQIGVVFQNPTYALFNSTVEKELCFHVKDKEYALEMGKRFGLDYLFGRHPQSLSEGEKRRLTIACALAKKPLAVFLDEPTVGQDYKSLDNVIKILRDVVDETKTSVFIITHDENAAVALADETYVLKDGKLWQYANPSIFFDELRKRALALNE